MMAKKTTKDCKTFLSNYFLHNASMVRQEFDGWDYLDDIIRQGSKPNEWVREWKAGPRAEGTSYYATDQGYRIPKHGLLAFDKIRSVRCFVLAPTDYDSAVRYLVIEGKNDELYLGEMVGD